MERLTEKIEDRYIERQERLSNGKIVGTKMCLKKLGELEDLEEQGLLLKLPCKVGDVVYSVECGMIVRDFVHSFTKDDNGLWAINIHGGIIGLFGTSVFTTLAEAEKSLKEMED